MTPITPPLPIPTGPRYWPIPTADGLYGRMPEYGPSFAIYNAMLPLWRDDGPPDVQATTEAMGAVLGLCWWAVGVTLDIPKPTVYTLDALRTYGRAVIDELLDVMPLGAIAEAGMVCHAQVSRRVMLVSEPEVQARANFTGSTPSTPNS